ncbi:MAG TPA: GNAT family N-acetyltransferase [Sphingomonas sp.]|nr:GNAT family N-acetyltransferase [Sphingomonas sp.]
MFAITERLLLRPGWAEDAAALTQAIGDQEIARNLTRVHWPYTIDDAESFLGLPQHPMRPSFLICLRGSNQLIGGIGLHGDPDAELGYWIARDQWNRGYATEAGRAVLALADNSLRLARIKAQRAVDNARSANVLRKLGFLPTGKKMWSASLARGAMETLLYTRDREEASQALAA